ncbi:MAG: hypothetical protein OXC01_16240 [Immundisolibacterales bacterium]|nr:hypothetical protein [Immundisolibacterales bacterium]
MAIDHRGGLAPTACRMTALPMPSATVSCAAPILHDVGGLQRDPLAAPEQRAVASVGQATPPRGVEQALAQRGGQPVGLLRPAFAFAAGHALSRQAR